MAARTCILMLLLPLIVTSGRKHSKGRSLKVMTPELRFLLDSGNVRLLDHITPEYSLNGRPLPRTLARHYARARAASRCQAVPYEEVVEIPGCVPRRVQLRACIGLCPSLYLEVAGDGGLLETNFEIAGDYLTDLFLI
ncbi:hypothetical protein CAPTEDRAFT_190417 [Capitella teleta]|uniref:DAN domain-containing protein n=1 Tax=Capitella teleta TaxID=283909 RepID=R7TDN8_CAPTE|nr:hypothetical protein CAPTEDRAFT_190417 [Capitella teleta]|eukprot:ELT89612.1 hypothetical protein CAPTEDRAFT_190417 [Capitella teleta]